MGHRVSRSSNKACLRRTGHHQHSAHSQCPVANVIDAGMRVLVAHLDMPRLALPASVPGLFVAEAGHLFINDASAASPGLWTNGLDGRTHAIPCSPGYDGRECEREWEGQEDKSGRRPSQIGIGGCSPVQTGPCLPDPSSMKSRRTSKTRYKLPITG